MEIKEANSNTVRIILFNSSINLRFPSFREIHTQKYWLLDIYQSAPKDHWKNGFRDCNYSVKILPSKVDCKEVNYPGEQLAKS